MGLVLPNLKYKRSKLHRLLELSGSAVGAVFLCLVCFLFRTVTGDVAFLLAVGACLVLILGSGLLLGVLELGRFLQVGLAKPWMHELSLELAALQLSKFRREVGQKMAQKQSNHSILTTIYDHQQFPG